MKDELEALMEELRSVRELESLILGLTDGRDLFTDRWARVAARSGAGSLYLNCENCQVTYRGIMQDPVAVAFGVTCSRPSHNGRFDLSPGVLSALLTHEKAGL